MNSTLENLFYGKINPNAHAIRGDSEYWNLHELISDLLIEWEKVRTQEDFAKIANLLALHGQASAKQAEHSFYEGFRLGVRLMTEVFDGQEGTGIHDNSI